MRETEASSTQSMASSRRRRSASGTEKMLWSKSAVKTRCTLVGGVYSRPWMVSASWRSRESVNCGSVRAYWRTLKPATAMETPATPSTTMTSHSRQLKPLAIFLASLAISVRAQRAPPRPQPRQHLLAGLPHIAGP